VLFILARLTQVKKHISLYILTLTSRMPRRPPPTALRLIPASQPLPRGVAKHTLPSVPRPALMQQDVSRVAIVDAPHPRAGTRQSDRAYAGAGSVYVSAAPAADYSAAQPQPRRRQTERGLGSSGIGTKGVSAVVVGGPGSRYSTPSPSPMSSDGSPLPEAMRGPWDHSRAVSLPIDVGTVLPAPKPVAISP